MVVAITVDTSIAPPSMSPELGAAAAVDADHMALPHRRLLRKIDRTLMPLLFFTYVLNFMDKIILSSAAVFGLRDDNVR